MDEVAFLYVSIDDNEEAWTKFLKNDSLFTGIHLISENAWRSKIVNDYVINGIPRYILIDQNGIILNADEQPPSSGEYLIDAIKRLL